MLAETKLPIHLSFRQKALSFPSNNAFLEDKRTEALNKLAQLELPNSRDEYWKYTRLAKTFKKNFETKDKAAIQKFVNENKIGEANIVLHNGVFDKKLSNVTEGESLVVLPLSAAAQKHPEIIAQYWGKAKQRENQFLDELTEAVFEDGVFIWLKSNSLEKQKVKIQLIGSNRDTINAYRNIIIVEKNAQLEVLIVEESFGKSQSLNLLLQENFVEENAHLSQCFFQKENQFTERIDTIYTAQKRDSFYKQTQICLGNELLRNNLDIIHLGENANTQLYGLIASEGNQHIDNHSHMDHLSPNCESTELFKGVYGEKSTAVFNGKVTVRQDAQKINAYQSSQNILLSDSATVNSKPELEIYADDVKCSHGSTTGQLDEDALFYLMARGISKQKAKNILVRAFLNEVIEQIGEVSVEEEVNSLLDTKLR